MTIPAWTRHIAQILSAFALVWLVYCTTSIILRGPRGLAYDDTFGTYERQVELVRELSCGRSDVAFSYYPWDLYVNFLGGFPTVGRYGYFLPWVADRALPEVRAAFEAQRSIVAMDFRGSIGPFNNQEYLLPLRRYLDEHGKAVGSGVWISKDLAQTCGSRLSDTPPGKWRG